ncbi:MAG: serpin family protein [Eggerthellaceae bacterium]|nr:serpin family protein [Eggerthellaceae bacterium]
MRKRSRALPAALAGVLATGALACTVAFAGCTSGTGGFAGGNSAIPEGASSAQEQQGPSGMLSNIQLVTADQAGDPLLAFAANSTMAVLNGPDANGQTDAPDSIVQKNLCFSPTSLYMGLSLLGLGTQGTTQEQLLTLLGAEDGQALLSANAALKSALEETYSDAAKIEVANSVWAGEGYQFTDAFLQEVQQLSAGAYSVQFGTNEANQQISSWVSDATSGLLKPEISTQDGQAALLANTVYFKDAWANPFNTASDEVASFNAPGHTLQTNFMRQEVDDSSYAEGDGWTAAQLAFTGGETMTFVRADEGTMLYQLLDSTDEVLSLLQMDEKLEPRTVDWWLPRFTVESQLKELKETCKVLGVVNAFSPESPDDFAPMLQVANGEDAAFCVSDVTQDVKLELDEDGVEAAAFTAVGIEKMALMPETEPVEFKLDRPFFYYVTSASGHILFAGVEYNPGL